MGSSAENKSHLAVKRTTSGQQNGESKLSVCLMNESSVSLCVSEKVETMTAKDIFERVYNQLSNESIGSNSLSFDMKYKKLFALWVTSPYLELQLQQKHRPVAVLANWDHYITKNGPIEVVTDPELVKADEPSLSFQRNVFCDKSFEVEIKATDIGVLYLLYFEAKLNVLDGRYPCDKFEKLAAFQAAIDLGQYDENIHTVNFFRQNLKQYIPCNYLNANDGNRLNALVRTLSRNSPSTRCALKIIDNYKVISKQSLCLHKLLISYLEICWQIPVYGSAYFSAQIERPLRSSFAALMSHYDIQVWVAVNRDGLHLISKEKPELLLSIEFKDLCWAVGRPENSDSNGIPDPECIPCIFVELPDEGRNKNILQIFSRQYRLIESILKSFIEALKNPIDCTQSYDCPDGAVPLTAESVTLSVNPFSFQTTGNSNTKNILKKKLSFATFDKSGNCINKTGSWVKSQSR
ncbi:FERM domain-containing protein 8-like [Oppia nitens]|uniref:FERM domain-containing protein 8-like n=1 Tax=Oppia nitens TaxID=1686743 RepID=UPI0023DBC745|nr:FERM domain-containing protein 8-like [Oppia nitens]